MRAPRVVVVLAAVAFAVATPLGVGYASDSSSPGSTGSIAGTVTGDGGSVAGACVDLEGGYSTPPQTHTDSNGAYLFSDLATSTSGEYYFVEVDASCSADLDADNYLRYQSTGVSVTAGQTTTVDVSLQLGGSAAGRILDASGNPLAGVCVGAYPDDPAFIGWAQGYTQTDADGSFVLRGVIPGDYRIKIDGCYASTVPSGPDIQPEYYYNDGGSVSNGTQSKADLTTVPIAKGSQALLEDQKTAPGADLVLTTDVDPTGIQPYIFPVDSGYTDLLDAGLMDPVFGLNGWKVTKLIPGDYKIGYQYWDPVTGLSRAGYIGYYKGIGVDGSMDTATAIPVVEGDNEISDHIVVPPIVDSTTTLSVSPNRVPAGSQMTITARVTSNSGTHVPAGVIDFFDLSVGGAAGGQYLGPSVLDSSGRATLPWTVLTGSHTIAAYYSGDGGTHDSHGEIAIVDGVAPGGSSGGGGGAAPPAQSTVTGTVDDGESLSSDPGGTPNDANPLIINVSTPKGGSISIDETPPDTNISGYKILNVGATITAPAATTSDPLKVTFQVFDGKLPNGYYGSDLTVFRDGSPVADCDTPDVAAPDPCVASRTTENGVTTIVVLSSHASTWDVEAANVGRIGGRDRITTAVAVSQDSFPNGNAGAVVLARADDFPDALVGAPLAAAKNAPLLLTDGAALPAATASEIDRALPNGQTVYVLGGPAAIPDSVVTQLQRSGYTVVRYGGNDRFDTAVKVADALGDPQTVLLATGTNFPDALAAGPAAAHVGGVVLLTNGKALPAATSGYVSKHADTVYAIGGPAAAADPTAMPVFGADRYATATAVATRFFPAPTAIGVATAANFPDALSGGAQLALVGEPLVLSSPESVPSATTDYLTSVRGTATTAHMFGGVQALADAVRSQIEHALGS